MIRFLMGVGVYMLIGILLTRWWEGQEPDETLTHEDKSAILIGMCLLWPLFVVILALSKPWRMLLNFAFPRRN